MSQFDPFTEADAAPQTITAPKPVLTRRGQYNALGLPTAAFLEQLRDAPEGDFDREDYDKGRWLRNLPLVPDASEDEATPLELPADDPVMKIIPPLNGLLMRAIDQSGNPSACRTLLDAIGRTVYSDEKSPARAKKQQMALHRWLRHTLLQELPDLPGITPGDLWHTLEIATPRTCPITASLNGRHLTQQTHDRLWLGIRVWEKPRGAKDIDDDSWEAEARREFIGAEQMVLTGIKPKQRASVRAAALNAASHLIAHDRLRIWPELYHRVHDVAATGHGLVKERAERLLEPLEDARDKAVKNAMDSLQRTLVEWHREPPR